jgi:hypothetical protein
VAAKPYHVRLVGAGKVVVVHNRDLDGAAAEHNLWSV